MFAESVRRYEAWRPDGLPTFHNAFPQSFDALPGTQGTEQPPKQRFRLRHSAGGKQVKEQQQSRHNVISRGGSAAVWIGRVDVQFLARLQAG